MITQAKGDYAAFVETVVSVLIDLLEICTDCSNGNWSYNNEGVSPASVQTESTCCQRTVRGSGKCQRTT